MPKEPVRRYDTQETEEEYRRRIAARVKRRRKRQQQRLMLIGAFVVAAILLVVCIVLVFRAVVGDKTPQTSSLPQNQSSSASLPAVALPGPVATDPSVWNLLLVNPQNPLPEGFDVETQPVTDIGHRFDARAADALKQMVNDCNAVEGHSLAIYSGYRGAQTQNDRYQYMVTLFTGQGKTQAEAEAMAWRVEPPSGYSEHQTGLAVDFVTGTLNEPSLEFAQTPEFAWLMQNAQFYGFILRYPSEKADWTGMDVQPYHFRYVGAEDAAIMTNAGVCLEEYLLVMPDSSAAGSGSDASAIQQSGTE